MFSSHRNKKEASPYFLQVVTIASGAALSGALDASGILFKLLSVQVPGTWTAADIGFQVSRDGVTYSPLYYTDDSGNRKRVKVTQVNTGAAGVYVPHMAEAWALQNYPYIKLESISTLDETAANQAGARDLVVGFLR